MNVLHHLPNVTSDCSTWVKKARACRTWDRSRGLFRRSKAFRRQHYRLPMTSTEDLATLDSPSQHQMQTGPETSMADAIIAAQQGHEDIQEVHRATPQKRFQGGDQKDLFC